MNGNAFVKSTLVGLAFLALASGAATAQGGRTILEVQVDNVRAGGGPVRIAVFDEADWLAQPIAVGEAPAAEGAVTVRIVAPRAGRYAVSAYQDTNSDRRLNRNLMGIPSEPWGASNDAPANFGPPSFREAAIDVSAQGARTRLRLR